MVPSIGEAAAPRMRGLWLPRQLDVRLAIRRRDRNRLAAMPALRLLVGQREGIDNTRRVMTDLKLPKPPARIRDKKLLARFAATRPVCQICGAWKHLEIHHMTDLDMHRRSDVFENLMRLCANCHVVMFHSQARWSKEDLRELKNEDEHLNRAEYAEIEMDYDERIL